MNTSPITGRLALLVGGGPAPGINGVISSVTIEAIEQGIEVIGFQDGFKWLVKNDNDLPLPGSTPTFGFETARHIGVSIVRNLAEDARTTSRWYLIISMGRAAGHLALGIGKAAAATLTIIPEEFRGRPVVLDEVCDILIGAIIKRKAKGSNYGVAVLAEGLLESVGEDGLQEMMASGQIGRYGEVARDP